MCLKIREVNEGASTVVLGVGRGVPCPGAGLVPVPAGGGDDPRFGEVPELGDSVPCTLTPIQPSQGCYIQMMLYE